MKVHYSDFQFTCPKCGSHNYGTIGSTGPVETWIGHCNGCSKFEWPRSDDWRYFEAVIRFSGREEYRRAREAAL